MAIWSNQPDQAPSTSAPFYDGVLSSGGFCYELPVVDGPFVYNGFVSWPFYYISFVRYWYLDLLLSQDYNNEVHRFAMYCATYACGDCVAPISLCPSQTI